ncbi:uncharacterized protein LOC133883222 [Phragmites australis]|uniref:uncharacterized protein LOC133883222 n=1 Tax=Phragmites australis TaxID=29695 RepID=UPI002D76E647|nr:uncharacterized protein LOC133883222 [Phragmites australis]
MIIHQGVLESGHPPRRQWKHGRLEKMPAVWRTALKKCLGYCKSEDSCDVIKRDDSRGSSSRGVKKSSLRPSSSLSSSLLRRSGCSRSISNLRDVIHSQHGRIRRQERQPPAAVPSACCSPSSIGSNDVMNAVTHDVLLAARGAASGREFRVGSPGRGGVPFAHSPLLMRCSTTPLPQRKSPRAMSPLRREAGYGDFGDGSPAPARPSYEFGVRCHSCGVRFTNNDALESHHLVNHAVTEMVDGDWPRRVVEIICKAGWSKPEDALDRVESVVKVHNMERSVARFEEFRETVMGRAAELAKKHPRCIADGNELLQFHGTTVSCSLGASGSHSLCTSGGCNVCRIIRHGFSATRESRDGVGVFTTSTSKRALECIQETGAAAGEAGTAGVKHALLLCRAIAGRIHRPLENLQDMAAQPGFDSVAGKVGAGSSIEELYLLNPRALLPCYVVICNS